MKRGPMHPIPLSMLQKDTLQFTPKMVPLRTRKCKNNLVQEVQTDAFHMSFYSRNRESFDVRIVDGLFNLNPISKISKSRSKD